MFHYTPAPPSPSLPQGAAYTPTTHPLQDLDAPHFPPEPPQLPPRGRDPQDHLVSLHHPLRDPPQPPGAAGQPLAPVPLREFGGRAPSLRGWQEASSVLMEGSRAAPHRPHRFLDEGFRSKKKKIKNAEKKKSVTGKQQQGHHWGV